MSKLQKSTFIVFIALLFLICQIPRPTFAKVAQCTEYHLVFARGSGQKLAAKDFSNFRQELEIELRRTDRSFSAFELGSDSSIPLRYPAVKVNLFNGADVLLSRGNRLEFARSVKDGSRELINYIQDFSASCPHTKILLGGYSQGALVIMSALPRLSLEASHISYIATFGDPKLYLPEGAGSHPPACRGEQFSEYRIFAPDCHAYDGILGTNQPYVPEAFQHKVGLWCNHLDIICSKHINLQNLLAGHTSYAKDKIYQQAARHIVRQITPFTPQIQTRPQNTAIVIDSTGSMGSHIAKYKTEAIRLATKTLSQGGKVALFEYRDLRFDHFPPRILCNFGCSLTEFTSKLAEIRAHGGGDKPESALSASLFALNTLRWERGANKSLVLLTDAGYHNPDLDRTTLSQVTKRALEIDPVNFYVLAPRSLKSTYAHLISATNGRFFSLDQDQLQLSTDYITGRPLARLAADQYEAAVDETITFDAAASTSVDHQIAFYEWDLDFDGIFEQKTSQPFIKHQYHTTKSGIMQVKVTDNNGQTSTMSATVHIRSPKPSPSITHVHSHISPGHPSSLRLDWTAQQTALTLITINNSLAGLTRQNHIELPDLDPGDQIRLIPVSPSGVRGEAKTLSFSALDTPSSHISRDEIKDKRPSATLKNVQNTNSIHLRPIQYYTGNYTLTPKSPSSLRAPNTGVVCDD